MTTLRDDGFLETDDQVVKACFGGRLAKYKRVGRWRQEVLRYLDLATLQAIRISASTVAEVTGHTTGNAYDNTAFIIINHLTMTAKRAYQLVPWLRKHTQGEE